MRLIHGNGVNNGKYPTKRNGVHLKEYTMWRNMISRCYSEEIQKIRPTYKNCTVSDNFKDYSYFYEWCQNQIGFGLDGWSLDKDLLFKGNKIYSDDTCVFIPDEINSLLTKRQNFRGDHPIGVHFVKHIKKYAAEVNVCGKKKRLGYFNSDIEAFNAYKVEKENLIKDIANKNKGKITHKAYIALINYTVDIED